MQAKKPWREDQGLYILSMPTFSPPSAIPALGPDNRPFKGVDNMSIADPFPLSFPPKDKATQALKVGLLARASSYSYTFPDCLAGGLLQFHPRSQ